MIRFLVRLGSALSELAGSFIIFRYNGEWTHWTRSSNESISGASYRWAKSGGPKWPEKVINKIIFWEEDHCYKSFNRDYSLAWNLLMEYEFIDPSLF